MQTVFDFDQEKGELVEQFYQLLVKGDPVSYQDVINAYAGQEWPTPSSHPQYGTLKKIVPLLISELSYYGFPVQQIKDGKKTYYKYIGNDPNPLINIRRIARLAKLKSKIEDKIILGRPMILNYHPFDRGVQELTFHPHLLIDYNGRSFVIGVSERADKPNPLRKCIIGIDRIEGDIKKANPSISYICQEPGEYKYLNDIVGVTMEPGAQIEEITLRTHDRYTFGRLVTKPIHHSQRILTRYKSSINGGTDYGDVTITVYPNKELIGQIMSFGKFLEVVSPKYIRERVSNELREMTKLYDYEE